MSSFGSDFVKSSRTHRMVAEMYLCNTLFTKVNFFSGFCTAGNHYSVKLGQFPLAPYAELGMAVPGRQHLLQISSFRFFDLFFGVSEC